MLAGWRRCALAAEDDDAAPHLILLPEVLFDEAAFLEKVTAVVERLGSCAIVVAEGIRGQDGQILSMQDRNQKGYIQLGGAGEVIAERIHACLGYKVHFALAGGLSAALGPAYRVENGYGPGIWGGQAAVRRALGGGSGVVGIRASVGHALFVAHHPADL